MLTLHYHPFSSFCQKVLVALYERDVPFTPRQVDLGDAGERAALAALWPMCRFPVLTDDAAGRAIPESSIIIEYLDGHGAAAAPLIPADPAAAIEVRLMDRLFDHYVELPMQRIVGDHLRPEDKRDPHGVAEVRATLGTAYAMLEERLAGRAWAAGDAFSLADCSAAPALFYAEWVQPFTGDHPALAAYFRRLRDRPSFARVLEEARPYRAYFPVPAPPPGD
ncbi:MAG: glutathione S-transferase family protein [Sphingomonas sp.]|nr:glutathione S-transferase family protein [Sphingomonas sp.]MDX3885675.1 glutathione S-transferase family protein [Sphingomonas sp.]